MKTTKTGTTVKKMTAAEATTELLGQHDAAKARFEAAKTAIAKRLAENPADAIVWNAEDMVKEQTRYERWMWIRSWLDDRTPLDALGNAIDEANQTVRRFFGSNSTSLFHNAVERAKAEACERLIDEFKSIRDYYQRHLDAGTVAAGTANPQ